LNVCCAGLEVPGLSLATLLQATLPTLLHAFQHMGHILLNMQAQRITTC